MGGPWVGGGPCNSTLKTQTMPAAALTNVSALAFPQLLVQPLNAQDPPPPCTLNRARAPQTPIAAPVPPPPLPLRVTLPIAF